jgi:type II pantothenate kinase
LCNIGTGVSIVVVNGENDFTRVSGSAIGGGTFWGLTQLLTEVENFDEAMKLAASGSAERLHLLVKDIYGGDYRMKGGGILPGTLTASFFAKPSKAAADSPGRDEQSRQRETQMNAAAICRGLITMIAQNVVQIAWLNAKLRRVPRVVFTGNFLRHNSIAMRVIAQNMLLMNDSFAGGFMPRPEEDVGHVKAMFLRHEGYFGAMGSFLCNLPGFEQTTGDMHEDRD